MKLKTRFILLVHLIEAPVLGIFEVQHGHRKLKDRGFFKREKCPLHMIQCTYHSATTSLFSTPPVHPTELDLLLFLAEREFQYGWAGITLGAIRKVILEVAAFLWYSWTKESFPTRTWNWRNKPTSSLSYLLETDSHLQLCLLYYRWRTLCIFLHFILCLCSNPIPHLMVQCSAGHLHLGSLIQRASWLTKCANGKHESWGALKSVSQYLNMKNPYSFKEGSLTSAFLLHKWFVPGLMKCQGFGNPYSHSLPYPGTNLQAQSELWIHVLITLLIWYSTLKLWEDCKGNHCLAGETLTVALWIVVPAS